MMKLKLLSLLIIITPYLFASTASAHKTGEEASLTAAGSGVNLGITRLLAEAFMKEHPTIDITIPGSIGSTGAIIAIKDSAITFGLVSRPLKNKEQSPDYTILPYAKTAIAIGTNAKAHDTNITSTDLVAIYNGTKTRWNDGHEIIVQMREAFDSGFSILNKKIVGFEEACTASRKADRWATYYTDQDANQALASTNHAIGITDLGMVSTEKLDITVLSLDGVFPSPKTIEDGDYPLTRTLSIVYRKKDLINSGQAFLDFLKTKKAIKILQANNYLALAK